MHEVHDGGVGVAGIDVVLHVHSAQLLLGGEALQLSVGDGTHQGGLAAAVGAAEPVPAATLEPQPRVVQQNLATCRG